MPIYEYRCDSCGHVHEVMQKISDRPLRRCGRCSGKLEKLISRTSFQLKGSGWYAQGYGSAKSASGENKKGGDTPKTDAAKPKKDSGAASKS